MDIVLAKQVDVAALVEPPVIELRQLGDLRGREHEIGQESGGASVAIGERMNPDCLGMNGDAELARCQVLRVLPAVTDGFDRGVQLDSDLLRSDADVQLALAEDARSRPDLAIEPAVQVTDEGIDEQVADRQEAIEHGRQQLLGDLFLYALLEVINRSLGDRLSQQLSGIGQQSVELVIRNRRLAITRREGRQLRWRRSERKRSTRSERTNPAGTVRRSSCADAFVERMTDRFTASLVTTRRSTLAPPPALTRSLS